jgi:hypothetical protein
MKPTRIITATALLLAGFVGQQAPAVAGVERLTPEQVNCITRDVTTFPDFYEQGREQFEQEIQRLQERQDTESEPTLTINFDPQAEIDRIPQVSPDSRGAGEMME